jgi:hypothetical protein
VLVEKLGDWQPPRYSKDSLTPFSDDFENEFSKPVVTLEFSRDRKSMGVMVAMPAGSGGKKTPSKVPSLHPRTNTECNVLVNISNTCASKHAQARMHARAITRICAHIELGM